MRSGTIAFLFGILWLQQWAQLPDQRWSYLLLPLVPLAVYLLKPTRRTVGKISLIHLPLWFFGGFLWALFVASQILSQGIKTELEGQDIHVVGTIVNLPLHAGRRVRFEFDVEHARYRDTDIPSPGRVRLNWYGPFPELAPGQAWHLTVRLKRPHGFASPASFDYESWLFQQRIRATGYVRQSDSNRQTAPLRYNWLQQFRFKLKSRLVASLDDDPSRALLLALVIGDRSQIQPAQWEILRRTGTNHLLAISGLHIGLVAGLTFLLVQFLWRFSRGGMLRVPAPVIAANAAIVAALLYAALAGFSIPTQRALIMVTITMLALSRRRHISPLTTLSLALLAVLVFDPIAVLSPGFWLSFCAVAVIFFALGGRVGISNRWWQAVRLQFWITLGLFPLLVLLFQQASLLAPLANLLAVPLVGLLIVPLSLAGTLLLAINTTLGTAVLHLATWLLDQLQSGLSVLSEVSFADWQGTTPNGIVFLLAVLATLILLMPRGWPGKGIAIFLLLPLFLGRGEPLDKGQLRLALLDVGQGLSVVVMTRQHTLVYDSGPRFSERFDTGSAVVVPYLRSMGVEKIDRLIISHGDNDHRGGARSILASFKTGEILSSVPQRIDKSARYCQRGEAWHWDGVDFRVLNPSENTRFRGNNASCVISITSQQQSILLTGDIETAVEKYLLQEEGEALRANILVAPHHGSKTSSTEAFIKAVNPDYVLFPVGYRNRFHFPHGEVLQRYRLNRSRILDTAKSGTISFLLDGHELKPEQFRLENLRYWQSR